MNSIITVESDAKAIVITDLHGKFYMLKKIMDQADVVKNLSRGNYLIVTGDFIHAYAEKDGSIDILEMLMYLKGRFENNVFLLLGNHEWSHIVGKPVYKGSVNQTAEFIQLLQNHYGLKVDAKLKEFVSFFASLQIAVRFGRMLISHAAPDLSVATMDDFRYYNPRKVLSPSDKFYPFLWARPKVLGYTSVTDAPYIDEDIELFLGRLGLSISIVGHTVVDNFYSLGKQLIVNSLDGAYLELEPKKYKSVSDLEDAKRVVK